MPDSSLQPLLPPIGPPPHKSQAALILFALICSNLFALFVGWIFEFLSLRGVVDVNASRIALIGAWVSGVVIICAFAWGKGIRAKFLTVTGGALMLALALCGLDAWAPKPSIAVDPRSITFDASLHRENFIFTVRNNTDSYAYGVQLKLKLPRDSSIDWFSFDIPASSRRPIIDGSDFADMGGILCSDYSQRPVVILLIYRMEPRGTRDVTITHKVDSNATIEAKISYFTLTPLPRMDDVRQMTGNIHIDEPMTCNGGIGFWLDPSRPPRKFIFTGKKL